MVQMFSCEFQETFKSIYFANVCESLLLKTKIFTGVSLRKVLRFYYNQQRQLFYYEGTSLYIPSKTPERINRVIFQNSSELGAFENTPANKNMLKVDKKDTSTASLMLFGCLYKLASKIFLKSVTEPDFRRVSCLYCK